MKRQDRNRFGFAPGKQVASKRHSGPYTDIRMPIEPHLKKGRLLLFHFTIDKRLGVRDIRRNPDIAERAGPGVRGKHFQTACIRR